MRPGAVVVHVEVLDQRGEGVQLRRGRIPAHEDFFGVGFGVKREHGALVFEVDFHLVFGLGVADGEAVADFDFLPIFAAHAEEGADYAVLVDVAPGGVVEDREDGLGRQVSGMILRVQIEILGFLLGVGLRH